MLFDKFGLNWPSGSENKKNYDNVQNDDNNNFDQKSSLKPSAKIQINKMRQMLITK